MPPIQPSNEVFSVSKLGGLDPPAANELDRNLAMMRSEARDTVLGGSSQDLDTWLITMVIVSLLSGVVGPLPNGLFMAYKWGLLTTY